LNNVSAVWRSECNAGHCIEVANLSDHGIGMRDSKRPEGPILTFDRPEFAAFVDAVKRGAFDDLLG
jgi:hypothetical protein